LSHNEQSNELFNEGLPHGYLITFRTYGTRLHGNAGSVDRFHNTYGTPRLNQDDARKRYNRRLLKQRPVKLDIRKRKVIIAAIKKVCSILEWDLWALNVRSNHVHAVITARCRPSRILSALKANSTGSQRCRLGYAAAVSDTYGVNEHSTTQLLEFCMTKANR
jgi:REP element-mobilizing transposase RayT